MVLLGDEVQEPLLGNLEAAHLHKKEDFEDKLQVAAQYNSQLAQLNEQQQNKLKKYRQYIALLECKHKDLYTQLEQAKDCIAKIKREQVSRKVDETKKMEYFGKQLISRFEAILNAMAGQLCECEEFPDTAGALDSGNLMNMT